MTISEMKKAEVLEYLNTAQKQIGAALARLAGASELRNEIHQLIDSPLDDIIQAIEEEAYEDDFRLKL